MGIIVQKFGGTSVGTGERMRIVADIIKQTLETSQVIVVVSAMSSEEKSQGTTSLLLEASQSAVKGEPFQDSIGLVRKQHLEAVQKAISSPSIRADMEALIEKELHILEGFLDAIEVIRELSPRSQDILMATGERLGASLLASTLEDMGVGARMVDLMMIVPESEREINPPFFNRVQNLIAERCNPKDEKVPVVTGFFGLVPGGLLWVVGRGYTDFTASLISAGLGREKADEMQVWKEVDGIFTADPRKVPNARVLPRISPTEATELTYFGSEVLHPFTMERVVAARIPIHLKNTFNPQGSGTVIMHGSEDYAANSHFVTAVTAKRGITIFSVQSNRMYNAHGFMARVFKVLEDYSVNVDLLATSEVSISCTVERGKELNMAVSSLEKLGRVSITPGRAILAMVGEGMKYSVGTAGKMFSILGENNINIEMISQGASEINISCVIKEEDSEKSLQVLHRAFLENEN